MIGQAQQELRESDLALRVLVDGTSDAIYLKDRLGRYVFLNAACARVLGMTAESAAGKNDIELFRSEEARLMYEMDQAVLRTGQPRTYEESLARADGLRIFHTTKTPYHGAAGDVIGVIGVSRDITERKRVEKELRDSEERQRLAVEAAHLGVWHWDIKEDRLGKLRLAHERVDLLPVVASALASVTAAADAKSLRIEAKLEPLMGDVLGDPARLEQVVSNLLSNAVKFTSKGGRIELRLAREGTAAGITVKDTGAGISPQFLPHVFDRFRQAESTAKRSHGGLGLGLAIVRHLVELHGGTVTAESPGEGQGATFIVKLPLVDGDCRDIAARPTQLRQNGPRTPVTLEGVRVVVIDDEPDTCELLEMVLRAAGAEVHTVHSARAALEAIASFRPHALISDIGMPGEDGYGLVGELRMREAAAESHLPAVALTAFTSQADREQALALGFDAHLAKPASPGDLVLVVARLVGRAA